MAKQKNDSKRFLVSELLPKNKEVSNIKMLEVFTDLGLNPKGEFWYPLYRGLLSGQEES